MHPMVADPDLSSRTIQLEIIYEASPHEQGGYASRRVPVPACPRPRRYSDFGPPIGLLLSMIQWNDNGASHRGRTASYDKERSVPE